MKPSLARQPRPAWFLALLLWGTLQNAGADVVTRPLRTCGDGDHDATAIAIAPDGRTLLTVSSDGIARLWDKEIGKLLMTYTGHSDGIGAAAFSADGTRVLTCSKAFLGAGTARLWDLHELVVALRLTKVGGEREIGWDRGTLQHAPTLRGPWDDLAATSPFLLSPIGRQGYFRVKLE